MNYQGLDFVTFNIYEKFLYKYINCNENIVKYSIEIKIMEGIL